MNKMKKRRSMTMATYCQSEATSPDFPRRARRHGDVRRVEEERRWWRRWKREWKRGVGVGVGSVGGKEELVEEVEVWVKERNWWGR